MLFRSTDRKWDFLQKCIHGTKSFPCVIIVPILSVHELNKWNGEAYEAIVLAGNWTFTIKSTEYTIKAAEAYKNIGASHEMVDSAAKLADSTQCEKARHLLTQMILCVCKDFNDSSLLCEKVTSEYAADIDKIKHWKTLFPVNKIPVPTSTGWNEEMKIRKISFSPSAAEKNPAPDPVLLLAKAAFNWLKRHGDAFLPVYDTGNDSSHTEYSASYSDETKYQTGKNLCISEISIFPDGDDVDEPLSEDENSN